MPTSFPEISYGGSLLLAWQLKNKDVTIVGGGNVAADRIRSVLASYDEKTRSPRITLICPSDGLNDEVRYRLSDPQHTQTFGIVHMDRNWDDHLDLLGKDSLPDLILTATDDDKLSAHIHALCKERRIVVNVADVPPLCDFYFGSVIKRGPLQIMVSTNGKGPRLANRIRRQIEDSLPENVGDAIEAIGKLRAELRKISPSQSDSKRRMEWMIRVTDKWSLDELCQLDEETRRNILSGFEDDIALDYSTAKGASFRQKWSYKINRMRPECWQGLALAGVVAAGTGVACCLAWTRYVRMR